MRALGAIALALAGASCVTVPPEPREFVTARRASDFESYGLRRVGLLPFAGRDVDAERATSLQRAFAVELARSTAYEVVALTAADVAELAASEPLRSGSYDPRVVLELARRFRLDGLFACSVTTFEPYTPQALSLELELVAAETGQPIWSSQIALDTSDAALRSALERWQASDPSHTPAEAQLGWLSPDRLAHFAAAEVARRL